MNADPQLRERLERTTRGVRLWSPDGERIAFASDGPYDGTSP